MMIIGCDFHPSWQQVSWLDTETGETGEGKLVQASGDAERFYRRLPAPALIGMEATGNCHWLVDLLAELGHDASALGVARYYKGLVDGFVLDAQDAALAPKVEALGMRVRVADTMMRNDQDKQRLATTTLEFVDELAISGRH